MSVQKAWARAAEKFANAWAWLRKDKKYLFFAAFLVLIAFCGYFYFALDHMQETLLREKIADRKIDVDTICDTIDRFVEVDNNWDTYDYAAVASGTVAMLDDMFGTYAELFDQNIKNLSERSQTFELVDFSATNYPELVQAMRENDRGEWTVWLDEPGAPPHNVYIYYRWVPTDASLQNRLLIALGVSKHTIDNNISAWVAYGAVALIMVSAVFIVGSVILLCRLGTIYTRRGGADRWRGKIYS